ncbi:O-antigen ligase [Limnohabitans sp. WS1]|uniref:O-antigen ligase family protein n=1 Tax=Limnohabitans sp. WS1 TaxID=1100726 RepID=UPI000D35C163|nr:O-antigen ligase family protein [Limnohabitans sp. WS1]PUE05934.1 hypothetical protein B9Z48_21155 [Limnohabitans sp. WS1]
MDDIVITLFFILCVIHFSLSISNVWWKKNTFQISLIINTVPFVFYSQLSQNELRFHGVPYGYFPIIASAIPYILGYLYSGVKKGADKKVKYPLFIFLGYCTLSVIFGFKVVESIPYLISWVLNVLLLLAVWWSLRKEDEWKILSIISNFIVILVLCCLIGLGKYFFGVSSDANFMPLFNRNATLIFICTLVPIVPALWSSGKINVTKLILYLTVLFFVLVFIESRSGLIAVCYAFLSSLYAAMKIKMHNKKISLILLAIILCSGILVVLNSGVGERFGYLTDTLNIVTGGGSIEKGEQDFDRAMLLSFAFEMIYSNPIFGVGIGLSNYQHALEVMGVNFHRLSKAHNFYISYLAEFGFVGFSILIYAFYRIYVLVQINVFAKQCFITAAILLIFNEYILLPELWYFMGLLLAYSSKIQNKNWRLK